MGNPQVTDFELGWLSGIIDGEGCFTMSKGSKGAWNVGFKLVNTSATLIEKFAEVLTKLGIKYHIYNAFRSGNQRPAKRLEVNGPEKLKHMLDILLPYIEDKYEQAYAIHDWCVERTKSSYGEMNHAHSGFTHSLLKELKKSSGTSTTTRETS